MRSSCPISSTNDLILEILSRLPSKSVARFRCMSKLWTSMLSSQYLKELFLTSSSAKPRILFAIVERDDRPMICNPITGRYAMLPNRYTDRNAYSFFGFDKKHKALSMVYPSGRVHSKILTFGDEYMKWRKVKCSLAHYIESEGICINGVLYYLGDSNIYINGNHVVTLVIVCFDLRKLCKLINYKGRLAMIYWEDYALDVLHLLILEDVEKQEWSKHAYTLRDDSFFCRHHVSIIGATISGEIVFSTREYSAKHKFYVFYFNPRKDTIQRVEIRGFGEEIKKRCRVRTFVNHVENLDVNDFKLLKSFHPPLVEPKYIGPSDSESD
ncbi:hypothetical protein CARUB_v10015851mg [Capsella rubella]|uniref:F-box domain-containing protein n=1 Tax=Capsella rubella TaxID=81985 RepID=R0GAI5_9BRAS|nr:hypothetical protein CARUB_v10015851mg [Capsella rubella]